MNQFLVVFAAVFLAELGDKTQIATLLFASSDEYSPMFVFLAASAALIASSGIAVVLGASAERYLSALPLNLIAGVGFVLIGFWTVWGHFAKSY